MQIKFVPQRRDGGLAVTLLGELLILNGVSFDLSGIGEGQILPITALDSTFFSGPITRAGGVIQVSVVLPYDEESEIDPMEIVEVTATIGDVDVPGHDTPQIAPSSPGDIDWDQLDVPESTVPKKVTMRQARRALFAAGLYQDVEDAINALTEPTRTEARIDWDFSSDVYRDNSFVLMLTSLLGLTEEQVDDLFIAANAIPNY